LSSPTNLAIAYGDIIRHKEVGMTQELAMFIDLENLRYSLLNLYGQEPDLNVIMDKAKKYGRPSLMKAYADFSEHPSELNRQLQVVGIDGINTPVKRSIYKRGDKEVERIKNAADMCLALDAIMEAIEADSNGKKKNFLIVAGDRDYVKLVTLIRNRFGQEVFIIGVPGAVSNDLVAAAGGNSDNIEVKTSPPVDKKLLKNIIISMVKSGPAPLKYWTVRIIDQWCQNPKKNMPGTAKERRDAIYELIDEKVLVRQPRDDTKRGRITEIILDKAKAQELGYEIQ